MAQRGAGRAKYAPAPQHADDGFEPDDESYGLMSTMCCESVPVADEGPEGSSTGWRYAHVGQGRGKYEKVHTYKYVGQGAGSFRKEEVVSYQPTTRLRPECVCLLLVALILLLIVLWPLVASLWPGGAVEGAAGEVLSPLLGSIRNGSNATMMVEGSLVVDNLSYDDVAGDVALNDSLAEAVEVAIASEATRAAQTEAGQPIEPSQVTAVPVRGTNNSVGVDFVIKALPLGRVDAVTAWLDRSRLVEGKIASHLVADAAVQAAAAGRLGVQGLTLYSHARGSSSSSTTAPPHETKAPSFDCDVDFSDCYECLQKSWSPPKLAWCCEHRGRGCETTTTSVVYDCLDGYENWRRGWSPIKKQFCCGSEGKGCETGDSASGRGGNTTSTSNSSADNTSEGGRSNETNASDLHHAADKTDATKSSRVNHHAANKTGATNASAAPSKSSSPAASGDGTSSPHEMTHSSASGSSSKTS
ncbi:unnamed protein product [Prorocentrum cordatum]|uniref:Uncharacterized protein n=1 Tax=Prorocentrum cordatum TaxID=2364126 RepID=A0ABN9XMR3_9DINO|nr:unnamed protein product [Polarella glacialis]|mmetsp:Transcript_18050/g.48406  ORF Transcript_18050/g.48406 Transcript_18050/m.48406 type:complete len:472 (-) Transcript_18050:361-1776(-)